MLSFLALYLILNIATSQIATPTPQPTVAVISGQPSKVCIWDRVSDTNSNVFFNGQYYFDGMLNGYPSFKKVLDPNCHESIDIIYIWRNDADLWLINSEKSGNSTYASCAANDLFGCIAGQWTISNEGVDEKMRILDGDCPTWNCGQIVTDLDGVNVDKLDVSVPIEGNWTKQSSLYNNRSLYILGTYYLYFEADDSDETWFISNNLGDGSGDAWAQCNEGYLTDCGEMWQVYSIASGGWTLREESITVDCKDVTPAPVFDWEYYYYGSNYTDGDPDEYFSTTRTISRNDEDSNDDTKPKTGMARIVQIAMANLLWIIIGGSSMCCCCCSIVVFLCCCRHKWDDEEWDNDKSGDPDPFGGSAFQMSPVQNNPLAIGPTVQMGVVQNPNLFAPDVKMNTVQYTDPFGQEKIFEDA